MLQKVNFVITQVAKNLLPLMYIVHMYSDTM